MIWQRHGQGDKKKTRREWHFRSIEKKVFEEGKRAKSIERGTKLRTNNGPLDLPRSRPSGMSMTPVRVVLLTMCLSPCLADSSCSINIDICLVPKWKYLPTVNFLF